MLKQAIVWFLLGLEAGFIITQAATGSYWWLIGTVVCMLIVLLLSWFWHSSKV